MKQLLNILLLNGLWLSTLVLAEVPNYDTSSGIVSFPQVTVNESDRYIHVDLLLNPGGTWKILAYEPEPLFDLTGAWNGTVYGIDSPDNNLILSCLPINTDISFIQNGNALTGKVSFFRRSCPYPSGLLMGQVIGNEVTFTVETPDYGKTSFRGHLTDDNRLLVGTWSFDTIDSHGDWILVFDK